MVLVELEPLVTSDIVVCLDALGGGSLGRSVVNRNGKEKQTRLPGLVTGVPKREWE